jgi:hypothetical protein
MSIGAESKGPKNCQNLARRELALVSEKVGEPSPGGAEMESCSGGVSPTARLFRCFSAMLGR